MGLKTSLSKTSFTHLNGGTKKEPAPKYDAGLGDNNGVLNEPPGETNLSSKNFPV